MNKKVTYIISILMILLVIFTNIYISIYKSISPNIIKSSISNNLLKGFIYDNNGKKTDIFNTILKLTELDEKTVIEILENERADEIITDIVNSIYDYNLTGDSRYKYTKEKIITTLENNIDIILDNIDTYISKSDREYAIRYTKENTQYILDTIYSTDIGDYTK